MLYVCNLEAVGARVNDKTKAKSEGEEAYFGHKQLASFSFIPVPDAQQLAIFTENVKRQNLMFRAALSKLPPRKNVVPRPVPERIGERLYLSMSCILLKKIKPTTR